MKSYQINSTKYLLSNELIQFEKTLTTFIDDKPKECLVLALALKTGARASELLNIRITDLNVSEKTIFIRGLKRSNDREIPLADSLFDRFLKFSMESVKGRSDRPIFNISYNRLRLIWEEYKPVNKKFHSLRHTFAIELYKKTKDIRLVQVALGHKSITNTMVYADYVYSNEELKKLLL